MSKDITKKRGLSWFTASNQEHSQSTQENSEQQLQQTAIAVDSEGEQLPDRTEQEEISTPTSKSVFSKENQDKVVLDLIVSMEKMIKDRQLILYKNTELDEQLEAANETISHLKKDMLEQDKLIQECNKEIRSLENRLTNKQMNYDQLLEDYKEHQSYSSLEYEKISNQLENENNKYKKLNDESMNVQYQNMLTINKLQETIRNLEVENQRYSQQYKEISEEKSQLMVTINDFTKRMTLSFPSQEEAPESPDMK